MRTPRTRAGLARPSVPKKRTSHPPKARTAAKKPKQKPVRTVRTGPRRKP